jgi:hypothetical protein
MYRSFTVARSSDLPCTKSRLSRKDWVIASTPSAVLWPICEPAFVGLAATLPVIIELSRQSAAKFLNEILI